MQAWHCVMVTLDMHAVPHFGALCAFSASVDQRASVMQSWVLTDTVRSALEWSFGVLLLKLTDCSTASISVALYERSVLVWARIQVQSTEPALVRDHPATVVFRLTLSCGRQPSSVMFALVTL